MTSQLAVSDGPATQKAYVTEYDSILETMQHYLEGGRKGKGDLMASGFHPAATIVGFYGGQLLTGPIQQLFHWIDQNGPAPNIRARFAEVDILGTIALVRLEVDGWTGTLAGDGARMSDLFTLVKIDAGWKITQKTFHWHTP